MLLYESRKAKSYVYKREGGDPFAPPHVHLTSNTAAGSQDLHITTHVSQLAFFNTVYQWHKI